MKLPPKPWSDRMKAQQEVLSAYLEAEVNIADKINQCVPGTKEEILLLRQLRAARLQSDAANEQMWIIYTEEQQKRD